MGLVASGQDHPGTSGALGAALIPADTSAVSTIEFAGATDVDYAVQAATAWPTSLRRALRASREIKAGCAEINDHIPIMSEMPLGGSKQSSFGKNGLTY